MSIHNRIELMQDHVEDIYDTLDLTGITTVNKNIANISSTWRTALLDMMNNGTNTLWNNWPKVIGEGVSFTLDNVIKGRFDYQLKGDTYQYSTTGKNICNIGDKTNSSSGLEITSLNQKITITGRNTNTTNHAIIYYYTYPNFVAGETYTMSDADGSIANSGIYVQINTNKGALFSLWGDKTTFTVPSDYTNCTSFFIGVSGTTTDVNVSFRLQIEQGSTKTDWEAYTGRKPSPNPDYPQDIQVVSGDNTIKVEGKNRFNIQSIVKGRLDSGVVGYASNTTDLTLNSDSLSFTTNANYRGVVSDYIETTPQSSTYIVFSWSNTISSTFAMQCAYYDRDKNFISQTSGFALTNGFRWNNNVNNSKYIRVAINLNSSGTLEVEKPQLEISSSNVQSTYKAYTGATYPINLGYNLPDKYQQVEYIQSSGTQYIDTGVIGTSNLEVEAKVSFTEIISDCCLLGSRNSNNRFYPLYIYPGKFNLGYYNNYNSNITPIANQTYNMYAKLFKGEQKLIVDGNVIVSENVATPLNTELNLYLFCNNYNTPSYYSKAKLYNLTLYLNGTLVRKFIPCYRKSDNEIGLYDIVENKFYTNSGTGTFTKGNDVENGIELCKIGDYQDKIAKSTGKNLWGGFAIDIPRNAQSVDFVNKADGTITANGTSTGNAYSLNSTMALENNHYITLQAGTYTLSGASAKCRINLVDMSGNNIANTSTTTYNATFTISEAKQCFARIQVSSGVSVSNETIYPMLVEGETPLPYEPYLAKGKWYLEKKIGKVVLDGSEGWWASSTYQGSFYLSNNSPKYDGLVIPYSDLYCNYFTKANISSSSQISSNYTHGTCFIEKSNGVLDFWYDNGTASVSDWKTWLGTHNVITYFPLATPICTEITDTTLINELESLELLYGVNNVSVNGELPATIAVTALKDRLPTSAQSEV